MAQCKAKSKRTGERCKQPAMHGSEVCYMHGGATPKGAASPHYKGKGYSKHMPTKLAERFNEADANPRLTDLRRLLALREAFVQERLEALEHGGDLVSIITDLQSNYVEMNTAYNLAAHDPKTASHQMAVCLDQYRSLLKRIDNYHATRAEIESALNEQRRDIDSMINERYKGERAIPVEQALLLVTQVFQLVQNIKDDHERDYIQRQLETIITRDEPVMVANVSPPAVNGNGRRG